MNVGSDVAGYADRIERLAAAARRKEQEVDARDAEAEDVDVETADRVVREGLGPTVSVYVEHRTGGSLAPFTEDDLRTLEDAMNTWLQVYCRCYGMDAEFDYTIREAAEVLVETHDARAVAEVLTKVP